MKPIRLNKIKREELKKVWAKRVQQDLELEEHNTLREAQDTYRHIRDFTWDSIISPIVEKNFPTEDMKVLKKYERTSYRDFTQTDTCFTLKPMNIEDDEKTFTYNIKADVFFALYHDQLVAKDVKPTISLEYETKDENPHFYNDVELLTTACMEVAKENGTEYDLALFNNGGSHTFTRNLPSYNDKDFGKFVKTVPSGSCHSRTMMVDRDDDWYQMLDFEKAKSGLTNAHRDLFKVQTQLMNDMNSIIDQSTTLDQIEEHWVDVKDCINFDNKEVSTALSIVSEDTKDRLAIAIANMKPKNPNVAAFVVNSNQTVQ